MNNRINKLFANNEKNLITFVTGGAPDLKTALEFIKNLPKNGSKVKKLFMIISNIF